MAFLCGYVYHSDNDFNRQGDELLKDMIRKGQTRGENVHQTTLSVHLNTEVKMATATLDYRGYETSIYARNNLSVAFVGRIDSISDDNSAWNRSVPAELVASFIHAYGYEAAFKKIHGDYCVSVYESNSKSVILFRSEFGNKKLVFYCNRSLGVYGWGSCLAQMIQFEEGSTAISEEYIADYITNPINNRRRLTPYKNIFNVLPGECVRIGANGFASMFLKEPLFHKHIGKLKEREAEEQFFHLFYDSVKNCLQQSTPEIVLHLSGGMDSSAIAYIGSDIIAKEKMKTAFLYYHTDHINDGSEVNFARIVAEQTNYPLRVFQAHNESPFLSGFDYGRKISVYEPSAVVLGSLDLEHFYLENNKVVITGMGGDQVINGNRFYLLGLLQENKFLTLINEIREAGFLYSLWPNLIRPFFRRDTHYDVTSFLDRSLINPSFSEKWDMKERAKKSIVPLKYPLSRQDEFEGIVMGEQWMPIDGFHHMDTRNPFLSLPLVEFCFSLPIQYKRRKFHNTKVILKKALSKYFHHEILGRHKSDHSTDLFKSFRKQQKKLNEIVLHSELVRMGIFNQKEYRKHMDSLCFGSMDKVVHFLKLLELDVWLMLRETGK
ncbi:asparagine synthetase B [Paenibacillus sp. 598K]|uniref:asparagine synthase-related protein n=1 Tax=Paenibacillus sp. 598K TaxID=1117987 RepID=UPI000FF9CA41|nr:asparagine synthase-related protein [Paenibacillus sp. 598K]GBF75267.1 asparagine synthetase B [Paenibacillus sp. 598K]